MLSLGPPLPDRTPIIIASGWVLIETPLIVAFNKSLRSLGLLEWKYGGLTKAQEDIQGGNIPWASCARLMGNIISKTRYINDALLRLQCDVIVTAL